MSEYINFHSWLTAWDNNERKVDADYFARLYSKYAGENTLEGLLFESFLRTTKNKTIQNLVLRHLKDQKIDDDFSNGLKKIYAAKQVKTKIDGKQIIQYNYKNSLYDENIDLFSISEVKVFDELSLLLFDNDWNIITVKNEEDKEKDTDSLSLIYGGGTNSIAVTFHRYKNVRERDIQSKFNLAFYNEKYNDNWQMRDLALDGILARAGVDKYYIACGIGKDKNFDTIEEGTFNAYLYKRSTQTLYEVSYFMNFSPKNIHFAERDRVFNFLIFQTFFAYLE
jgi:hypothetical protein